MDYWALEDAVRGAFQPAQSAEEDEVERLPFRVVSFNCGVHQEMLTSKKQWSQKHSVKFQAMLSALGRVSTNDFVFTSEVGGVRQGFKAADLDFRSVVKSALPNADCESSGAYLHMWNIQNKAAKVVASGTWTATTSHPTDMYWQAFDVTYRGASQPADRDALQLAGPKVGVLVGNMHIPVGGSKAPSTSARCAIVGDALQHLTGLEVDGWRDRPVMRVLVGDCNLDKHSAEKVTQEAKPPRLTALQRDLQLSRWQVLSTCDARKGDVMFVLGAFGEECMVPIGASFVDRGMRNDQHDAVAALLSIPIGLRRPGGSRPAASGASQPAVAAAAAVQALEPAGGAPQPAVAASAAEQAPAGDAPQPAAAAEPSLEPEPAAGSAPQPATPPAEADAGSFSPDYGRSSSEDGDVTELHERLLEVEEADDISEDVQMELAKILFKKKTITTGGIKRQYVATREETLESIKKLLQRRKNFMAARDLHDAHPTPGAASRKDGLTGGASQPADHRYLFTEEDREQVMREWKKEFHALPQQLAQQKRDSWKPTPPPPGAHDTWGCNMKAVRSGKNSRFARHLQLEAGSKTMAELIIYAGRYDPEFLKRAHEARDRSSASQPAEGPTVQQNLKRAAATAKLHYRKTCILRRRVDLGEVKVRHLPWWEQQDLQMLEDGSLLSRTNKAVAAYGHGTLRREDGASIEIGGSTQGVTRFLLDGCVEPDVDSFLDGS